MSPGSGMAANQWTGHADRVAVGGYQRHGARWGRALARAMPVTGSRGCTPPAGVTGNEPGPAHGPGRSQLTATERTSHQSNEHSDTSVRPDFCAFPVAGLGSSWTSPDRRASGLSAVSRPSLTVYQRGSAAAAARRAQLPGLSLVHHGLTRPRQRVDAATSLGHDLELPTFCIEVVDRAHEAPLQPRYDGNPGNFSWATARAGITP